MGMDKNRPDFIVRIVAPDWRVGKKQTRFARLGLPQAATARAVAVLRSRLIFNEMPEIIQLSRSDFLGIICRDRLVTELLHGGFFVQKSAMCKAPGNPDLAQNSRCLFS